MHLKTWENFPRKCIIFAKIFPKFSAEEAQPLPRHPTSIFPPYSEFLDPPLVTLTYNSLPQSKKRSKVTKVR